MREPGVRIGAIGGYLGTQVMERVAMKLYEWEPEEARQQEDEARSGDPFIGSSMCGNRLGKGDIKR